MMWSLAIKNSPTGTSWQLRLTNGCVTLYRALRSTSNKLMHRAASFSATAEEGEKIIARNATRQTSRTRHVWNVGNATPLILPPPRLCTAFVVVCIGPPDCCCDTSPGATLKVCLEITVTSEIKDTEVIKVITDGRLRGSKTLCLGGKALPLSRPRPQVSPHSPSAPPQQVPVAG